MPAQLRLAIIGAGRMGRWHAEVVAADPGTTLVAVCDPFTSQLGDDYRVPTYTDLTSLLTEATPDAVITANPNDQHVDTALQCVASGVPVLLEKPVATSLADARKLHNAATANAVPVLVGHHRRHNPLIEQTKAILDDHRLGTVTTVTALWQMQKPRDYFDAEWRREPGAGVLLINLVHDIDLLRYLFGEIESVQAVLSNTVRGFEVDDTAAIIMRFESGAVGTLTGSDATAAPWSWDQSANENKAFAQHSDQPCYLIAGTDGALSVPQLDLWTYKGLTGWANPLDRTTVPAAPGNALANQLRHFAAVVRGDISPRIDVIDAGRTLAVVNAVQRAATEGRSVRPETF